MKFLRSLLIAGAILFALIHFGSNFLIAQTFERWLGVRTSVQSVRWGFSSHRLVIKNLKLHNPTGYSDKDFAKFSRIQADYDASNLRHGLFKITRLEMMLDEVQLERKSVSESNLLELEPLRTALRQLAPISKKSRLPMRIEIDRVKVSAGNVTFKTQLGNDAVTENRRIETSEQEMTELRTPDSVAVYVGMLVLKSAGWQSLVPTRNEIVNQFQTQVNGWVEQLKQKAQVLQAQVNQTISEKLAAKK